MPNVSSPIGEEIRISVGLKCKMPPRKGWHYLLIGDLAEELDADQSYLDFVVIASELFHCICK